MEILELDWRNFWLMQGHKSYLCFEYLEAKNDFYYIKFIKYLKKNLKRNRLNKIN